MSKQKRFAAIAAPFLILAGLSACTVMSGRETAGEYVDDATTTAKVTADLIGDPMTSAAQINVETMQGIVQLSGFVDSNASKARAQEIANDVEGVRHVENDIIVRQ